jgi:long-chain acyl-CoA synthetase
MIAWWGPVFWDDYGCSELGNATFCGSHEWLAHPGTVGRAAPDISLKILDEAGNELPSGEIGLVYFARDSAKRFAYRNDDEKTAACYRGDLFTVGDVGYLDKEGYLFLCDRTMDMVVCGGAKIYSAEIEQVLIAHPQVMDCAVVGVPDPLFGEVPIAVVQPAVGARWNAELTREISRFLRGSLSIWKVPRRIEYVTELPRDASGKLNKRRLREKLVGSTPLGVA